MENFLYAVGAAVFVSSVSFIGIVILLKRLSTNSFITALISFAAGGLIGDVFLHLFPEHIENYGYDVNTVAFLFVGIILMLVIEAYFHCSHDSKAQLEGDKIILAKMNIIGDALHNFLDGVAIGASFLINPVVGLTSTIAIMLHEIPQELADTSVLLYSGMRRRKILLVNFATGLTSVLGVFFVFLLGILVEGISRYLVPIAIGQFIYISLADLLPEIHKKSNVKKYLIEVSMFIFGIAIMYSLTFFE